MKKYLGCFVIALVIVRSYATSAKRALAKKIQARLATTESINWVACDPCNGTWSGGQWSDNWFDDIVDNGGTKDYCADQHAAFVNQLCYPGTANLCPTVACGSPDANIYAGRNWQCICGDDRGMVIYDESYKLADGGATAVNAAALSPSNIGLPWLPASGYKGQPAIVIDPSKSYSCVPCDPNNPKVAGGWCKPAPPSCTGTASECASTATKCDDKCDPCDPNNANINSEGWFCQSGTANVCVNKNGWAHLNAKFFQTYANGTIVPGSGPVMGSTVHESEGELIAGIVIAIVSAAAITCTVLTGGACIAAIGGAFVSEGEGALTVGTIDSIGVDATGETAEDSFSVLDFGDSHLGSDAGFREGTFNES